MSMLIIAGNIEVPSEQRDAFVTAHQDLIERARQAPGCLDVAISADPVDPARVNTYELWESWSHIQAWRAVANAPDTGIPILRDDVRAYEIAAVRSPFE
jgi:quinol monooxygenase YgiN